MKDGVERARILDNLCCVPETGLALHNCTGLALSNRFAHYIGAAFGVTPGNPFPRKLTYLLLELLWGGGSKGGI